MSTKHVYALATVSTLTDFEALPKNTMRTQSCPAVKVLEGCLVDVFEPFMHTSFKSGVLQTLLEGIKPIVLDSEVKTR